MTVNRRAAAVSFVSVVVAVAITACSPDPERAKHEYLKSGDRYFDQQKFSEAIVQYRNALQQDAKFGDARLKLARTYEKLGDVANATREYVRAADALPSDADAQVKAGKFLLLVGQFEEARSRAEKALKLDAKNFEAQVVLGNSLAGLKNFDGALQELEEAVKLDPGSAPLRSAVGVVQMALGKGTDAEAAFRKAVALNPKAAASHLSLASYLWVSGRLPEAEQALKQALTLEPTNVLAHRGLATLYIATRRAPLAEPHLKALAEQDNSPGRTATLTLADYYIAINKPEAAMNVLDGLSQSKDAGSGAQTRVAAIKYVKEGKAAGNRVIDDLLARDPANVPGLLVKARFQIAEGKLDEALRSAQSAASADPQSVQARYLVGTLHRRKQQPDEAIQAFTEVLKINPRATAAQVQLAELNLQRGHAAAALQLASDAARQMPRDPRIQLTLIHSLIANGETDRAEKTLKPLLAKYPNTAQVQAAAGTVAMTRNDLASARRAFARAAELDFTNLEALNGLVRLDISDRKPEIARGRVEQRLAKMSKSPGVALLAARVYGASGDLPRAEAMLKKVIELDPAHLEAYVLLGQLYASQSRLAEARASFEALLKTQPNSVPVNTVIGVLYSVEGNRAEARKRFERVLQIDPGAAVAANNLAYIYAEDGGNLDVALQLAQTAKQKLPESPEVADTVGWIYVKKELASLGVPQLEQAVAKAPDNAMIQYHFGVALSKTGDEVRARKALERALALKLEPNAAAEAQKLVAKFQS